ncbi:MAG: YraN family protein [Deltaproteobacteria bacterium]|nr:YraN family protein [Deltaproteobacteria bacterium]
MGGTAEVRVADALAARGYRVVGRNVEVGRLGELDLVVRNARELVVVEVRSRRGGDADDPADSIGPGKRMRVRRTAAAWLEDRPIDYEEVRLFVGIVHWKGRDAEVTIVEDAF